MHRRSPIRVPAPAPVLLVALLLVVAALPAAVWGAGPARAQEQPRRWVPLADATIHPGVQTVTAGGQCTANFVFTDADGAVYLGQAAHCASQDDSSQTDGCRARTEDLGVEVEVRGATRPGRVVYSSWITMQAVEEADADTCTYNDFALVALDPADWGLVNPSLPHYGGPHGLIDQTSSGDPVYTFGNSGLRPDGGAPKEGTSSGQSGGGWTHSVRTVLNPGIPGDSGSGFLDEQGRAFGVLSTLEAFPDVAANGVSDLSRMLAYLTEHTDLDVTLADGTLVFDPDGASVDTAEGPSAPAGADVRRLAGPAGGTRVETAVAISQDAFPRAGASAVVLGRADVAADALAGTPLAAAVSGPLLLTQSSTLHPATEEELQRVLLAGMTVYVLGGEEAISPDVVGALMTRGYRVVRLSGASRVETAITVAGEVTADPAQVLLADGTTFAEALVAGPAAAAVGGVVLLTDGPRAHPAVDAYLAEHPDAEVVTVGAAATTAYPGRRSVEGGSGEVLSRRIAEEYFPDAEVVGIARVDVFADALAGGAHIARAGGPVLLTPPSALSGEVAAHLRAHAPTIDAAALYGGTRALSERVAEEVRAAISG